MQSKQHFFYKVKVLYLFNQVKKFSEVKKVFFKLNLAKWEVETARSWTQSFYKDILSVQKKVGTDDNVDHRVGTIKLS